MDCRAYIKISFTQYGKTLKTDMSINYFPDGEAIDPRITQWIESAHDICKAHNDAESAKERMARAEAGTGHA